MLIVVSGNSVRFVLDMPSRTPKVNRVVSVLHKHQVWQSSNATYPAATDPNINSGFAINTRSPSRASELRSFVVLRPSPALAKGHGACRGISRGNLNGVCPDVCSPDLGPHILPHVSN